MNPRVLFAVFPYRRSHPEVLRELRASKASPETLDQACQLVADMVGADMSRVRTQALALISQYVRKAYANAPAYVVTRELRKIDQRLIAWVAANSLMVQQTGDRVHRARVKTSISKGLPVSRAAVNALKTGSLAWRETLMLLADPPLRDTLVIGEQIARDYPGWKRPGILKSTDVIAKAIPTLPPEAS